MRGVQQPGAESGIFVWRGQVARLSYIHTHTLFYYIHPFLFYKLYIYTHPTTKKELRIFNQNYI